MEEGTGRFVSWCCQSVVYVQVVGGLFIFIFIFFVYLIDRCVQYNCHIVCYMLCLLA